MSANLLGSIPDCRCFPMVGFRRMREKIPLRFSLRLRRGVSSGQVPGSARACGLEFCYFEAAYLPASTHFSWSFGASCVDSHTLVELERTWKNLMPRLFRGQARTTRVCPLRKSSLLTLLLLLLTTPNIEMPGEQVFSSIYGFLIQALQHTTCF